MANVYVGMSLDILHHGHINIIENARKYGDVIVGLLTDRAIAEHKRLPYLTYEQRKKIAENINGVVKVVQQNEWDYAPNILQYKPDFMIHGSDWLEEPFSVYRDKVIVALSSYGGKLIEIPYTKDVSSSLLLQNILDIGTTPEIRKSTLKRLFESKRLVRIIEAHSPISALIAEKVSVVVDGKVKNFDGFWSSSLTDSTHMGMPDIEALDITSRLRNIDNIFQVTTKPLIFDADTGGKLEHFEINIKSMERLGISAVIIEDKSGLKKNSLFGNSVLQTQEDVVSFSDKIRAGRNALINSDFFIIARIESLILEKGMNDAISRAEKYIEAGASGIMIHSRKIAPDEIFEFAKIFRRNFDKIPLVCVPTTYNETYEKELDFHGFNLVIYANHLLRAAYPAMKKTAESILINGRSSEIEDNLISINNILELIPGTK